MAANPTIVPQLKLALENKSVPFSKPRRQASANAFTAYCEKSSKATRNF
jgi:hypothetical protein